MTPYQEMEDLADKVRVGSETALDKMLVLARSYMEPEQKNLFPGIVLTPTERRLANRLFQRPGETVSRESLLDAMYFDSPNDEPGHRILDVYICKLRRKFVNTKFSIPRLVERKFGYAGIIAETQLQIAA